MNTNTESNQKGNPRGKFSRLLRSKIFWALVILLLVVRLAAPPIILKQLNSFLGSFSPVYAVHINSLGISLFRGAYHLHGIDVKLKKSEETIFKAKLVDVSLAWRDIFRGKLTTDIVADTADGILSPQILNAFKNAPKKTEDESKKAASKVFPLKIERIDVKNSSFQFADLPSVPESGRWRLTKIDGRASNITASEINPLTLVSLKAALFDSAFVKVSAQLNQIAKPLAWDTDVELKDFNLPEINRALKRKIPLTFTSGKLNLYAEVKSENDKIEGYVKPFFKNADVVANNESFSGLKNFGVEVSTAAANLILRNAKTRTLATKALFSYDSSGFKFNSSKAISDAIKNGFSETIPEGLEDEVSLSQFKLRHSQKGEKP